MVIDGAAIGAINLTDVIANSGILSRTENLITIFQAIGGFIIAYIIFNSINIWHNWNKSKETTRMRLLLEQINKKLDNRKIGKR